MSVKDKYDHRSIEESWQKKWLEAKLDVTDISAAKKPFYNLMMFPYPSAEGLHVGNMYAFTGSDIYGRFKRMQGYSVFEPIGLDGFGIHSENYALKIGKHPMDQAKVSQKRFYDQLHRIGAMFDWSRTLETYDLAYYRWTQWLFVQMFKHGLAYRAKAQVNWCPSCKTVLADEQVVAKKVTISSSLSLRAEGSSDPELVEGESRDLSVSVCERCGNIVEKRLLEQWFFRITAYAEKLLENTRKLDWSEKVLVAQRNWIGKKEGINITYPVVDEAGKKIGELTCFTTRPDTNFGATFVVIAPEHPFVSQILTVTEKKPADIIRRYIDRAKKTSGLERIAAGRKKTGVATNLFCINQLNGYRMPLYLSDFVIMEVGTGAVVGVPGHDQRDLDFAKEFDLPVKVVVVPQKTAASGDSLTSKHTDVVVPAPSATKIPQQKAFVNTDFGVLVNSGKYTGLTSEQAIEAIFTDLQKRGLAEKKVTYHLRDWLISRQRYWGPPIPMVYCEKCAKEGKSWFTTEEASVSENPKSKIQNPKRLGFSTLDLELAARGAAGWYPVPEDELPVKLPYIKDYKPGDDGVAPLTKHKEFYETKCPGCGSKAVRETEVSDTFLDSAWYFLKYPSLGGAVVGTPWSRDGQGPDLGSVHQGSSAKAVTVAAKGMPPRAATRARLPWDPDITRRWLPVSMYTGGAEHSVLHLMYSRFITMALHDWGYLDFEEPFPHFYAHGLVIKDGAKMSKSKGNVVNPDEYIKLYGADSLRLYLMFMGPFDQGGDFRDSAMEGMYRWINRVWRMATQVKSENQEIKRALHRLTKKVTEDIEKRRYNTAIAAMMEFTNFVASQGETLRGKELRTFILLLAPFAPHLAEELYQRLSAGNSKLKVKSSKFDLVHLQLWPSFDPKMLEEETVEIVVQVNGKLRDTIQVQSSAAKRVTQFKVQSEVEKLARKNEKVKKFLEGQTVKKVIFVPGKLINFVI